MAAGNHGVDIKKGPDYAWSGLSSQNAVIVGSISPHTGKRSTFSNYGEGVVFFSGENCKLKTWRMFHNPLKKARELFRKIEVEGTSFSSPRVANATLLKLLDLRKENPKATASDAYAALNVCCISTGLKEIEQNNKAEANPNHCGMTGD